MASSRLWFVDAPTHRRRPKNGHPGGREKSVCRLFLKPENGDTGLRREPQEIDEANESIVIFADDNVAVLIHGHAPNFAYFKPFGVKIVAITVMNESRRAIHENMDNSTFIQIKDLASGMCRQEVASGGNRPDAAHFRKARF